MEIQGFKSFADRTVIEFGHGLTAIVGPNGSGKSNLVDAIRWVLGEQNPRVLRAQRMEDLIFSGSAARRAVSICEVTLVLDNSDGGLPVDFEEAAITRRMARDGISEYYINRVGCRLKDITDLFYNTGVGKEAYSVVGQGKIDEILLAKPEDRRGLFEEASGIARYKSRKRDAMRKLEETDAGRLRLADLMQEIENQIGPLGEEAQKAERARQLAKTLRSMEVGRILHKLAALEKALVEKREQTHAMNENAQRDRARLQAAEHELASTAEHLARSESELKAIKLARTKAVARLQNIESERTLATGRRESLSEGLESAQNSFSEAEQRLLEGRDRLSVGRLELAEKTDLMVTASERAERAETDLREIEEHNRQINESSARELETVYSLREEHSSLVSESRMKAGIASKAHTEIRRVEAEIGAQKLNIAEIERAITDHDAQRADLLVRESTQSAMLAETETQIKQSQKKFAEQRAAADKTRRQLSSISARRVALTEMRDRFDGYAEGPKNTLSMARSGRIHGILGAVAQVLSVKEGYERAIEAALGGSAQNIVAESAEHAEIAIASLKSANAGRATFLPLDTIRNYFLDERQKRAIAQVEGAVAATDLISCDEKFKPLVQHLLGRCAVVSDVNRAVRLGRATSFSIRIATLEGDTVSPGGSMTGGSRANARGGLFSRRAELSRLVAEERELKKATHALDTGLGEITAALSDLEERRAATLEEISRLRMQTQATTLKLENLRRTGAEAELRTEALADELRSQKRTIEDLVADARETMSRAFGIRAEWEKIETAMDKVRADADYADQKKTAAQAELGEAREHFARAQEIVLSAERLNKELEERIRELGVQRDRAHSDLEYRLRLLSELDTALERLLAGSEEATREAEQAENAVALAERNRVSALDSVSALERLTRQLARNLDSINIKLIEVTAEETGLATSLVALKDNLEDRHSLTVESASELFGPVDETADSDIDRIRADIEALGPVNPRAPEQLEQARERLEFVSGQDHDLEQARISLVDLVEEMDATMARLFTEAFGMIRTEFKRIFKELFAGGEADLILTDPQNALESGIEITARPDGRVAQPLTLLSGGEKSLSAIALLFAMQRLRPSPFCVLDEIEASLDEANVERFCSFMGRMSRENQYILITHQKRTMEISDVLHGLTTQEAGVSRTISYKLAENV